jgi:hypothetical protein
LDKDKERNWDVVLQSEGTGKGKSCSSATVVNLDFLDPAQSKLTVAGVVVSTKLMVAGDGVLSG